MRDALVWLAIFQGGYFFITGLWPIFHMRSFLAVTGPKHDLWLVKTVGALIAVIGLTIALGGFRREIGIEIAFLAAGSAAALAAVDVIYVTQRVIPKIYLCDAAAEAILIAAWLLLWRPQ